MKALVILTEKVYNGVSGSEGMGMPTINDIAREAGVSHGTVSNVINGRGNVSVEKIRLVLQTAQKLGYKVNAKAQSLRQGKDRAVAVLLPGIEFERCAAVYEVLQRELSQRGYAAQLYSTRSLEITEREMLTEALNARAAAIVASTCLPDAPAHYRREAGDLPLIFLQDDGPAMDGVSYAGFDMQAAGRSIAEYVKRGGAKKIAVFTDCANLPDTAHFLEGFGEIVPAGEARYLPCPNHQIELRAFELFEGGDTYDCVVCADSRREAAVRAACAYASCQSAPRFVTLRPRMAVTEPSAPVYELDDKRLAHRIARALLAHLAEKQPLPEHLRVENSGFRALPSLCSGRAEKRTLRLLTVASPSSAALGQLLPHLEKSAGIRLDMTVLPLADVYDELQSPRRHAYDLIRMDVAWLDELAEAVYRPLDGIAFDWDALLTRFIPELGENYVKAHRARYCLPYDPSTQLLFYRRDLFEDPTCKRMYFEAFHEELTVPDTFAAYNRAASFFTRSVNPASPIAFGSTVAIGNVVVSPSEFMPRLFEAGGSLLDGRGRITLDSPQALAALRNYRETYAYSEQTVYNFWKNVLTGFADGSAAMTVVFINYASHILNLKMSSIAGRLGFAPVPGKKPLLGGGVIGVTLDCAAPEAACDFFSWLYSDSVAPVLTMLGGLSPCRCAYANRDINEKYPWLSQARASFALAQRRKSSAYYANFSELQLENILATHIQRAVLGRTSPEQALRQAQADCAIRFTAR